jgi:hypothetical protein
MTLCDTSVHTRRSWPRNRGAFHSSCVLFPFIRPGVSEISIGIPPKGIICPIDVDRKRLVLRHGNSSDIGNSDLPRLTSYRCVELSGSRNDDN